ncbi:MAG: leucine-rich repeat protein, partial [Clostridia bacterium]|nr:leucine-rich repeat protein [Clostridia bacterium]
MFKLKKIFIYLFVFAVISAAGVMGFTITANAYDTPSAYAAYTFTYTETSEGLTLTGYTGSGDAVVIPETIGGKPVIALSDSLFTNNTSIKTVQIPKTVNMIGSYASYSTFNGCASLTAFTVDAANDYYFSDNGVLYSKINGVPCTLMYYPAKKTSTSYSIKNGTQYIGAKAGYNNDYIQTLSFPSSLLQIGISAFENCSGLTNVNIPTNINYVGYRSFADTNVTAAGLTIDGTAIFSLGTDAFFGTPIYDGATNNTIYSDDNWALGIKGTITSSSISLPNGCKGFAGGMFAGNWTVTSIDLKTSLKAIPDYAFANCKILESITIPDSVTYLGRSAFQGCIALTTLDLSKTSIDAIRNETFYRCSNLSVVSIPSTITSIAHDAFLDSKIISSAGTGIVKVGNWVVAQKGTFSTANFSNVVGIAPYALSNSSLTSVTLPDTLLYLGDHAFSGSISLTSLTINGTDNLQMGEYAFSGLTALNSLDINNVTSISDHAFEGSMTTPSTVSVSLPATLVTIGNHAFQNCTKLTAGSFTIPSSVTSIGYYAFQNTGLYNSASNGIVYKDNWALDYKGARAASSITFNDTTKGLAACVLSRFDSLTSVTIPDSVKYIGTHAFYKCTSLEQITFSENLESIGDYAFFMCRNLEDIMFKRSSDNKITKTGEGVLYNSFNANVFVRPNYETNYHTAENWDLYADRISAFAEIIVSTGTTSSPTTPATYFLFPTRPISIDLNATTNIDYYFVGWTINGDYFAYVPDTVYSVPNLPSGGIYNIVTNSAPIAGDYTDEFIYNGSGQGPAANAIASRTLSNSYTGTGYSAATKPINTGEYTYNVSVYYDATLVGTASATNFTISPKELELGYWSSTVQSDYEFNGSRILPIPTVTDPQLGVLAEGTDYTVSHGQNYSSSSGGSVSVTGIGNYQTTTKKTFNIQKISQSGFFLSLRYQNNNVFLEELEPDHAEYEISFIPSLDHAGNYITLYAYTDALYSATFQPLEGNPNQSGYEAKQLVFTVNSDYSPSSPAKIEYQSDELVEIGGTLYSRTVARLYLSNEHDIVQYGLNTITVSPAESPNYNHTSFTPIAKPIDDNYAAEFGNDDPTPLTHVAFFKKDHVAGTFVDITKTYGDTGIVLKPDLNSGSTSFTMVSDNPDVITVGNETGLHRNATIHNAGEATITLTHPGLTDLVNPAYSFGRMSAEITITVQRTMLTVYPADKTVVYGTAPDYSDIASSYVFEGFKYDDDISMVTSIVSGYHPSSMKNYGVYYLTAEALVLDTAFTNYNIYYKPGGGQLTVLKKTLTATIEDMEKVYGDPLPSFTISYEGWVYSETPSNAAGFVAPTINYNGIDWLTPKGHYDITMSGGYAQNYTIDISDKAKLIVTPTTVEIALETKTVDYNAKSWFANEPVITGIEGGSVPTGSYNVFYYIDGQYTSDDAPINVDQYKVKIEYLSNNINYVDATVEFPSAIIILPVAPDFVLSPVVLDYTADFFNGEVVEVREIENGSIPKGTLSFVYYCEGVPTLPKDSGNYSVEATYNLPEGVEDNYQNGASVYFEDAILIEKVYVTLELEKAVATYTSSDGISPDRLHASQAVAHGVYTEYILDSNVYPHSFSYRYFVDGEWQAEAPFNRGIYNVEVTATFTDQFGLNYKDTVKEFVNAVEIVAATLPNNSISLQTKTSVYTGKRVAPNAAIIHAIPGCSEPIGTFKYLFARHGTGEIFDETPVVNVNFADGANVGYDVLVRFDATETDNYEDYEQRFDSAIIIMPTTPRIIMSNTVSNFTGIAYDISKLPLYLSGIVGGSTPHGDISYRFSTDGVNWTAQSPVNAGVYSISADFTPDITSSDNTHWNYVALSTMFSNALTINKVAPILSIVAKKADYTGSPVTLSVSDDIKINGVSPDFAPAGTLSVSYNINDAWSNEGPIQSGSYKIKVTYTALPNENYMNFERVFNNGITVDYIEPTFMDPASEPEVHIFNGQRVITSYLLAIDGEPGNGMLSIQYKIGSSWTSRAPSDVETYDIRIVYTAAAKDNYKNTYREYEDMLVILPKQVTVTPKPNQSKVFDYQPINHIEYDVEGLIEGDSLTGALSAGDETNVGDYNIIQGTLTIDVTGRSENYGNNYDIHFIDGVTYGILPAEVEITFSDVSESLLVYRPYDNKGQYISVNAQYNGINVPVAITIIGDATKAGDFIV